MKGDFKIFLALLSVLLAGIIIHIPCSLRAYTLFLTTPFLVLFDGLVLYGLFKKHPSANRVILLVLLLFVLNLIIEITAQKTGKIFGNYTYGDTLWFKIAKVPVLVALNYTILILCSFSISKWMTDFFQIKSTLVHLMLAGGFLVFLDYFIQPVATSLDYWQWKEGYVPVKNSIALFFTGLAQLIIIKVFRIDIQGKLLSGLYILLLVYFMLLQVVLTSC